MNEISEEYCKSKFTINIGDFYFKFTRLPTCPVQRNKFEREKFQAFQIIFHALE